MLEVPGSIPAAGKEKSAIRTRFPSCHIQENNALSFESGTLTGGPVQGKSPPVQVNEPPSANQLIHLKMPKIKLFRGEDMASAIARCP